jgi:hypothetical protein
MIIDDLNAFGRTVSPDEADSPLIVDSDTILILSVTAKVLKPVAWNGR